MKKSPERFTLKFNSGDPLQRAAMKVLERQGRHKAQFLAIAILYYNANAVGGIPLSLPKLDETAQDDQNHNSEGSEPPRSEQTNVQISNPVSGNDEDVDRLFAQEEIPAISETLAAFLAK